VKPFNVRFSHPDLDSPITWEIDGETAAECIAKIREFDADRIERLVRHRRLIQPKPISGADLTIECVEATSGSGASATSSSET
jgi:hypothetical protein